MNLPKPDLSLNVDASNPGHFFASCGLFELAHRLWPGVEAWFDKNGFQLLLPQSGNASFNDLSVQFRDATLESVEGSHAKDDKVAPIKLDFPFDLRLDWWLDDECGQALKTWAGRQSVFEVASAMKAAMPDIGIDLFNHGDIVNKKNKSNDSIEPFYFDARRFAHALDTGFSLDAQDMNTFCHPAVEILCLIGLQRFRPMPHEEIKRTFTYWTWSRPLTAPVAVAVACGATAAASQCGYCFSLRFRDNQKRYKAFSFATKTGGDS